MKRLALSHAAALEEKAQAIAEMSHMLRHLADQCEGDHWPDCPVIEDLAAALADGAGSTACGKPA